MCHPGSRILALSIILGAVARPGIAADPPAPAKKVLVELSTSQGCNSCPPASDLLGQLGGLGYGPEKVVVLNFHVDYFNTPWVDPYSDAAYSRRQLSYNDVQGRNDLYFTPLMMVDGRTPLLGSDRPKALAALAWARKEPPAVAIDLALAGEGARKSLTLRLAARSPDVAGRELLVGVAVTEDPVTTRVPSGENAGRTLVEHHVVRRFDQKFTRVERAGAEVALDPEVDQPPVLGEPLLDPQGMVAEPPAHHVLARGPGQVEFDVRQDLALAPVGEGVDARRDPGELGDEGVADPDRGGEVLDEGLEEEVARAPGRPLDDRTQGGDFVIDRRRRHPHLDSRR